MGVSSLSDAVESFLQWSALRLSPSTVSLYRHYLFRFRDNFKGETIADVRRLDIELFSVKKVPLEILRRFFAWCVDVAQVLDKSPCKGVPVPRSGHRGRVLTRREIIAGRRRGRPYARRILLALEHTGARPQEVRALRWEWIRGPLGKEWTDEDMRAGNCYWQLEEFKGRKRRKDTRGLRVIPIAPRLGRLLLRIKKMREGIEGQIFLSRSKRGWSANSLRCTLRRLFPIQAKGATGNQGAIVPYTYRHSLATMLANENTNARLLADFLGHADLSMLGWYVHPSAADLCRLLQRREKR